MAETLQLILFPALVILGWTIGERNFALARRLGLTTGVILGWQLLVLFITGYLEPTHLAQLHGWLGHSLVITAWVGVPLAIGISLGGQFRRRPALAIATTMLVLITLGVVLLASFTGYLGPSRHADDATLERFDLLHTIVLPALGALLVLIWCGLFAPARKRANGKKKTKGGDSNS